MVTLVAGSSGGAATLARARVLHLNGWRTARRDGVPTPPAPPAAYPRRVHVHGPRNVVDAIGLLFFRVTPPTGCTVARGPWATLPRTKEVEAPSRRSAVMRQQHTVTAIAPLI